MEGLERRSESPPTRTRSSSRLSNISNQDTDSEPREAVTRKRASKRLNRNSDKENGEEDFDTNGVVHTSEDQNETDKGEVNGAGATDSSEVEPEVGFENGNGDRNNGSIENSVAEEEEQEEEEEEGSVGECVSNGAPGNEDRDASMIECERSLNGGAHAPGIASSTAEEVVEYTEGDEVSPKTVTSDSLDADAEDNYYTADTDSLSDERKDGGESSSKDSPKQEGSAETANDRERNGFDVDPSDDSKASKVTTAGKSNDGNSSGGVQPSSESGSGFLSKWAFKFTADRKAQETNGHSDADAPQLYFSLIKGRVPLGRASPNLSHIRDESKDNRRGPKTPNNARNLDDSFGVKSEPSRMNRRLDASEKPNLRKFPAKRCLNADESDDRDESFLSNLTFNKRRKMDDNESRIGFLRSFLRSPFRKAVPEVAGGAVDVPQTNGSNSASKSSWFRSPFWFWKRCNGDEERD